MTFATLASTYLTANILVALAFILLLLVTLRPLHRGVELKLHYFLLGTVITLSLLHPLLPKKEIFKPIAKVWVAESSRAIADDYPSQPHGYLSANETSTMTNVASIQNPILLLTLLLFAFSAIKLTLDLRRLLKIRAHAIKVRQIGAVSIYVSDEIHVPLSFWLPLSRNIILPEFLLGKREYKMAILHELQHHRQGDTQWVYILWALKLLFAINPIIHLWNRWVNQVQEYACDEALVGQGKVESRAYASCLIRVAESALTLERQPVCATGLMFLFDRKTLKRRIKNMFDTEKSKAGWRFAVPIGAAIVAVLGFTAYASVGLVQDRRVTLAQAKEMARALPSNSEFPIVVNERVVKWLNFYIGTPDGREKVKAALTRMENYRGVVERKIGDYRLPSELLAVPLIEAGYQNLEPNRNPYRAAGLWQFIASTARIYGLRVDNSVDERLHVELSTDAALRYLLANKLRFNDWQLSALAYNAGEETIGKVMRRTGSRDPWVLVRSGLLSEETTEYLPKLMAAILIIKNPNSVD